MPFLQSSTVDNKTTENAYHTTVHIQEGLDRMKDGYSSLGYPALLFLDHLALFQVKADEGLDFELKRKQNDPKQRRIGISSDRGRRRLTNEERHGEG